MHVNNNCIMVFRIVIYCLVFASVSHQVVSSEQILVLKRNTEQKKTFFINHASSEVLRENEELYTPAHGHLFDGKKMPDESEKNILTHTGETRKKPSFKGKKKRRVMNERHADKNQTYLKSHSHYDVQVKYLNTLNQSGSKFFELLLGLALLNVARSKIHSEEKSKNMSIKLDHHLNDFLKSYLNDIGLNQLNCTLKVYNLDSVSSLNIPCEMVSTFASAPSKQKIKIFSPKQPYSVGSNLAEKLNEKQEKQHRSILQAANIKTMMEREEKRISNVENIKLPLINTNGSKTHSREHVEGINYQKKYKINSSNIDEAEDAAYIKRLLENLEVMTMLTFNNDSTSMSNQESEKTVFSDNNNNFTFADVSTTIRPLESESDNRSSIINYKIARWLESAENLAIKRLYNGTNAEGRDDQEKEKVNVAKGAHESLSNQITLEEQKKWNMNNKSKSNKYEIPFNYHNLSESNENLKLINENNSYDQIILLNSNNGTFQIESRINSKPNSSNISMHGLLDEQLGNEDIKNFMDNFQAQIHFFQNASLSYDTSKMNQSSEPKESKEAKQETHYSDTYSILSNESNHNNMATNTKIYEWIHEAEQKAIQDWSKGTSHTVIEDPVQVTLGDKEANEDSSSEENNVFLKSLKEIIKNKEISNSNSVNEDMYNSEGSNFTKPFGNKMIENTIVNDSITVQGLPLNVTKDTKCIVEIHDEHQNYSILEQVSCYVLLEYSKMLSECKDNITVGCIFTK